jgi:hypothetical protein
MAESDGSFVTFADREELSEHEVGPERFDLTNYRHPGPVAQAFFEDRSFLSFIQGPYGSAKTTTCFFKLLARAMRMPVCKDGVRRYRALVLRDTYRRMERTAIRSWTKWFPKDKGWSGGQDRPSRHQLTLVDLEGVRTDFDIEFAAVGDSDVEDFMGGYEVTDIYLNEANLQPEDVLTYALGRCGRFPSMKDLPAGASFDYGVIGDLNAPEPDSWLMRLKFGELDDQIAELGRSAYFLQPGGREPGAENLHNLPENYYTRLAAANAHQPWWVARMIDNKSGYSRHGKPVYEVYNDSLHASREVLPIVRNLPLHFGFDAGLHPSAVAGQQTPDGQMRIVAEFLPGHMGPTRFGEALARWLDTEARGVPIGEGWVDPTAYNGADAEGGELNWVQIVERATGIRMQPAPSNEPGIRQDAVSQMLVHMIDGRLPGLFVSSACPDLRKGFASHYRFVKVRSDLGDGYAFRPQKNEWSHVHDALQYLCLGRRGKEAVIGNRTGSRLPDVSHASVVANTDFSVF